MSAIIDDDAPMTLAEACETLFRGAITPATLRAEAARGNLVLERIGRRDFVTAAAIQEMRVKCREQRKAPACGSTREPASGMSETDRANAAQAAALASARALRKPLQPTSQKSTSRPATVLPFSSRTS
jgi:hypothetical protein